MGQVPVVHEVSTSFQSLGHAMNGKPRKARKAWKKYAKESVIGSGVYAAGLAIDGNEEKAREVAKGMARATGTYVCGNGVLSDVPVFKELSKCGKSLGDAMCGETAQARKRWTKELVQEYKDPGMPLKATTSVAFTAAGVGVTVASGGLAAPALLTTAAATGAACGAGECLTKQAIDVGTGRRKKIDAGEAIGAGLNGAAFATASAGLSLATNGAAAGGAAETDLTGTTPATAADMATHAAQQYPNSMSHLEPALFDFSLTGAGAGAELGAASMHVGASTAERSVAASSAAASSAAASSAAGSAVASSAATGAGDEALKAAKHVSTEECRKFEAMQHQEGRLQDYDPRRHQRVTPHDPKRKDLLTRISEYGPEDGPCLEPGHNGPLGDQRMYRRAQSNVPPQAASSNVAPQATPSDLLIWPADEASMFKDTSCYGIMSSQSVITDLAKRYNLMCEAAGVPVPTKCPVMKKTGANGKPAPCNKPCAVKGGKATLHCVLAQQTGKKIQFVFRGCIECNNAATGVALKSPAGVGLLPGTPVMRVGLLDGQLLP